NLPGDQFFNNTQLNGSDASLEFELPPIVRAGFELRPIPRLRVELGIDYEAWSIQRNFRIFPHGVTITGVPGVGTYTFAPMFLNRNLNDSVSAHLGAEVEVVKRRLVLRGGYLFESSATPDETMTVLTADGLHNMITFGLGVKVGPARIDVGYAHLFTLDRN